MNNISLKYYMAEALLSVTSIVFWLVIIGTAAILVVIAGLIHLRRRNSKNRTKE